MLETSKVTVQSTGNALQVKASSREFEIIFDEPEASGGANTGMNPVEGLLCALGACETIATMIFANIQGVQLDGVRIEIEGDLDSDGFLGINTDVRNGFQNIRCKLVASGPDKDAVLRVAQHASKQCPVADCLKNPVPVTCAVSTE